MFTPEQIKDRLKLQPFIPFRIVTSSGEGYEVRHPDLVWVGARDLQVGTAHPTKPTFYNLTTRLALMHVTALEDLPAEPAVPNKNGPAT
jgi:hypothetical protein